MGSDNSPESTDALCVEPFGFNGIIGVARRDITPPVGIYARQWGAALHDVAEGIHRPLCVTVLSISDHIENPPLILIALDAGWFRDTADELYIRESVLDAMNLDPSRVILNLSHTHAACSVSSSDADKPGGHLIKPYLDKISGATTEAALEAHNDACPASLSWVVGSCKLASNRDLPDPNQDKGRIICGYNPENDADDTLLVGRVTRESDDKIFAVIFNYACHPTTLAWENRLISPDYVGAAREIIEAQAEGALGLFLQGASGELAPNLQYTGDTAVADRHGRQLGYAVLSALESMLPGSQRMRFGGAVESGAPLAKWNTELYRMSDDLESFTFSVDLPVKPQPAVEEIDKELENCDDRVMCERLRRKIARVRNLGGKSTIETPVFVWRVGQAIFIGQTNECYSNFQIDLRKRFPRHAVIVMNLANSTALSYLYPREKGEEDIYQVWVSPFDREALPILTQACIDNLAEKIPSSS